MVRKRVWKITFFGLKSGQDLENRAAHPHQEFPGVPPPPGLSGKAVIYFLHARFGILFKVRHFVINDILIQLYYSLVYPFRTYGLIVLMHRGSRHHQASFSNVEVAEFRIN